MINTSKLYHVLVSALTASISSGALRASDMNPDTYVIDAIPHLKPSIPKIAYCMGLEANFLKDYLNSPSGLDILQSTYEAIAAAAAKRAAPQARLDKIAQVEAKALDKLHSLLDTTDANETAAALRALAASTASLRAAPAQVSAGPSITVVLSAPTTASQSNQELVLTTDNQIAAVGNRSITALKPASLATVFATPQPSGCSVDNSIKENDHEPTSQD